MSGGGGGGACHFSQEYQAENAIYFNFPNHSIHDMEISPLLCTAIEKIEKQTPEKKLSTSLER